MRPGPTITARRREPHLHEYLDRQPTYPEVGATRSRPLPPGYLVLHQLDRVGRGRRAFDRLAGGLMHWDLQRSIGLGVSASSPRADAGSTVISRLRLGPIALLVPCRVVYEVAEPDAAGFGYGSLPHHPLIGEERFTAEIAADGTVALRIVSFSIAAGVAGFAPRVARAAQAAINRRYAAAAARLAEGRRR